MTPQPESAILQAVRAHLRLSGWFVIRHQAGLGTHKGLSDLEAVRDGRTVYIECKTATGRLTDDQERFRADIEAHGGTYIVARCVDDVDELAPTLFSTIHQAT